MPDRTTYAIMVSLPETVLESERANYRSYASDFTRLVDQKKLYSAKLLAEEARARGLKVAIIFDYFKSNPYHGKPPHVSPEDGTIVKSTTARGYGLGYLPFAWVDGWNYARTAVYMYVQAINPDFIQQGVDHSTMNWYSEVFPEKPHWGYNDVMGMFAEGIRKTDWTGTYVVSAYYNNTLRKAGDLFGAAMRDKDLLEIITFDLGGTIPPVEEPPPVDDSVEYVTKDQLVEVMLRVGDFIDQHAAVLEGLRVNLELMNTELDAIHAELDTIQADLDDRELLLTKIEGMLGWLL